MTIKEYERLVQYLYAAKGRFMKGEELTLIATVWADLLAGFDDEVLRLAFRRVAGSIEKFPQVSDIGDEALVIEKEQEEKPKQLEHWEDLKTLRYHGSLEHYELYGEGRLSSAAYEALKAGEFDEKGLADADEVFTRINKHIKDVANVK